MTTISLLKNLTEDEELLFKLVEEGKNPEVMELVDGGKVRINCLDKSGMNPLDHASYKGNEQLVEYLIERGGEVNNRHNDQGYTALMFAALTGKSSICQLLMNADARSDLTNTIGKSASELAAFVGHYECVSVISSHISIQDVERILHPNGSKSDEIYPEALVHFIHRLTRSPDVHPVRMAFKVMDEELITQHRKKVLYTVDRLFEKQLRCKEPNEMMSLKLWLILFTLREMVKFVDAKSDVVPSKAIALFAKNLISMSESDLFRSVEEQFLRTAISAFPYKQSMLHATLAKSLSRARVGQSPPAFIIIYQMLFGSRIVETGQFCLTCGVPSSKKRCVNCKLPYCSADCQKFDWVFHKKCCEALRVQRDKQENAMADVEPPAEEEEGQSEDIDKIA